MTRRLRIIGVGPGDPELVTLEAITAMRSVDFFVVVDKTGLPGKQGMPDPLVVARERLLDRLVDSGKSVIVIEHHQGVMAHADWIIDLGPGAGHDGGRIVFEGTPAELVADGSTLTGRHLAEYVGA